MFRLNGTWIVTTLALLAAVIWIGLFAHSHQPYRNALWWDFTWHGDASRFLRASLAAAVILAVIAFNSLMTGKARRKQLEPAFHELSFDLMRHRPGGPGFAMDALLAELMLWGAAQGYHWFSLGAAPFSGIENRQLAPIWNRIGGFVYEHGEHFYNFGGLATPRILNEINVLISGGFRRLMK